VQPLLARRCAGRLHDRPVGIPGGTLLAKYSPRGGAMTFQLQRVWSRGVIYLALVCAAAYFLMPIYVLVITGLKPYADVNVTRMWELPRGLYFGSFAAAWSKVAPNFWNSVNITVPAAIISSLIGSINGYVFAKWRFRGSDTLFILFLVGM